MIETLDKFTLNQRILLKKIANTIELKEPTAAHFLSQIRMTSGTVVPALKVLRKKDMIYVDGFGVVRVLDPLIKYMLGKGPK